MKETKLTDKEQLFCELFMNGAAPYAGNALKCYQAVFESDDMQDNLNAKKMLARDDIKAFMAELEDYNAQETAHMKQFLTENLKHIIEETSTAVYRDRRGNKLSPAALRSVAVTASKALMDMYPVKEAQVSKLNIEGGGENGIVFNVIVPDSKPKENETD